MSRIYAVSPSDTDRYALRLLLLRVPGATSFKDLRTYQGVVYPDFIEAAKSRSLLLNNNEFENCMREAVLMQMPAQLRNTFVQICMFCHPGNTRDMWRMFAADMSEDYRRHLSAEEAANKVNYSNYFT